MRLIVNPGTYTDGLAFVDGDSPDIPGIEYRNSKINAYKSRTMFLTEGVWIIPYDFRITSYTLAELRNYAPDDSLFTGITDNHKISLPKGMYYLEYDPEFDYDDGFWGKVTYYKLHYLKEDQMLELLSKDLSLFDKGNLDVKYNKLQIIDWAFE